MAGIGSAAPPAGGELDATAALLVITCAAFVGIGLLTPITQLVAVLIQVAALGAAWGDPTGFPLSYQPWQARICQAAIALSLALTGPGAYSLDARLFGRREISIPPRARARRL